MEKLFITTNVRISVTAWKRLKKEAAEEGISLSELFRRFAERHFQEQAPEKKNQKGFLALREIMNFGWRSGHTDTAQRADEMLTQIRLKQNKISRS